MIACINLLKYILSTDRLPFLVSTIVMAVVVLGNSSATWAGCHCFRDRSFDPSHPASTDPYVLVTARNSLLAAASETNKGGIVKMRMSGASETDLWMAVYLDSAWGRQDQLSEPFTEAKKDNDRDAMAAALANSVLEKIYMVNLEVISELRSSGADTSEITLSLLVSSRTRPAPLEVFTAVRSGKTTWGKTLNSIGIALETTGELIAAQVRRSRELE